MPRAKQKTPQKSSGARMRAAGFVPIQLWVTPEDRDKIAAAAKLDGRQYATQFLIYHGLRQASKILEKSGNSP